MGSPQDIQDFLRRPHPRKWKQEIREGWAGPDGSTMSTDAKLCAPIAYTKVPAACEGVGQPRFSRAC